MYYINDMCRSLYNSVYYMYYDVYYMRREAEQEREKGEQVTHSLWSGHQRLGADEKWRLSQSHTESHMLY